MSYMGQISTLPTTDLAMRASESFSTGNPDWEANSESRKLPSALGRTQSGWKVHTIGDGGGNVILALQKPHIY